MDNNIINALFRDPVINRLTAEHGSTPGTNLPKNLVARVAALKTDAAVLRWEGGTFTAVLNAAVVPGETLYLEYKGIRQGLFQYRIIGRCKAVNDGQVKREQSPGGAGLLSIVPGSGSGSNAATALVRLMHPRNRDNSAAGEIAPLLELFIETDKFGLILVRFYYHKNDRLECRFIVESEQAGRALQHEAESMVAENSGEEGEERGETLSWSVGNLRQAAALALNRGGLTLNKKA